MEPRPGGFITLHHQLWDSPDLTGVRAQHLWVFATIIHLANWKDGFFWFGATRIEVKRGELAHSIRTIATEARATEREVRTTINNLLSRGVLLTKNDTENDTRVRVLRVANYDKFQGVAFKGDTNGDKGPTGQRHGTDMGPSPIEPSKPERTREEEDPPTPAAPVLALVSKPARKGIKRVGGDPRHAPLTARLMATFEQAKGARYGHRGGIDARKIADLLLLGTDDEIDARWRRALANLAFPSVSSLSDLVTHWNHFSGASTPTARPTRGMAAPSTDWTSEAALKF